MGMLLGNRLSLWAKVVMRVSNSVVVVGLYYGFLTTFSKGPGYLVLLRVRGAEEEREKVVSATTGFFMGQLLIFMSVYYAPLRLALDRPHTITFLVIPVCFSYLFKSFLGDESPRRNSMRNLTIQCTFLENLIVPLFNHFLLPSATLARLSNIYMFRCTNNNKGIFLLSSALGWLICQIFWIKLVELVLFRLRWMWKKHSNSIRIIRSNNSFVSDLNYFVSDLIELINSLGQSFSIILFITCLYYLGRIPHPHSFRLPQETSETVPNEISEMEEGEEERDVEIETTYETKVTKKKQEGSTEEEPSPFWEESADPDKIDETEEIQMNGKEKSKARRRFEKMLVTLIFDYNRWHRPLRYIKNNLLEGAVREEMSQFFFGTCRSDGKQRLAFTYPPSLSKFYEMIQRKVGLCTPEKLSKEELYNHWIHTNEERRNNLIKEFRHRLAARTRKKGSLDLGGVLEKRTRLSNDKTGKKCLPKRYDPFLNGPRRGTIKKLDSTSRKIFPYKKKRKKNRINKLYNILTDNNQKFEEKMDRFDEIIQKDDIKIKEISKKVPVWPYELVTKEPMSNEQEEEDDVYLDVRFRKAKRIVLFTDTGEDEYEDDDTESSVKRKKIPVINPEEIALMQYVKNSDFRRSLINGSKRNQRRKTVIWKLYQIHVHSPLFVDRTNKIPWSFDIPRILNNIFRKINWKWMAKGTKFKLSDYGESGSKEEQQTYKKWEKDQIENEEEENDRLKVSTPYFLAQDEDRYVREQYEDRRMKIAEEWEEYQPIRSLVLLTHSFLRKYILLPSLIIVKNIVRILLFQRPEWSEDLRGWKREIHVKCTYDGVALSETEFPKEWLLEGIQIKILFPFCLKPWHGANVRIGHRPITNKKGKNTNFYFLTVWGLETDVPFGSPLERPNFFKPIFKELKKEIRQRKKTFFKFIFKTVSKKIKKRIDIFLKIIIQQLVKLNPTLFSGLKDEYELSENESVPNSKILNQGIHEYYSMNWTNYSLTEKKMQHLSNRTRTIRNKIKQIINDKKKKFLIPDRNISTNEISCNDKRIESPTSFWQILKRRSTRLIRKRNYLLKLLIEKAFLCLITIPRINEQLFFKFLELKKKIIDKYNYNEEKNAEVIHQTNENKIHFNFISTLKNTFSYNNINGHYSKTFCDLFSLSQAYVFYKLSQTQAINKYYLRFLLQYHGGSSFLKHGIKNFVERQGIFHSEARHKKPRNDGMNEWKNWLRGQDQHDLSQFSDEFDQIRLLAQRLNRVNKMSRDKNIDSTDNIYRRILFKNKDNKNKLKKNYRYALLSHEYIDYDERKNLSIYVSPVEGKEGYATLYKYNTDKPQILDGIDICDYMREDKKKNMYRKYFDWRILNFNFCLKKKINKEDWPNIHTSTNSNKKRNTWKKNTKTWSNSDQLIDNIDIDKILQKDLYYRVIHKPIKTPKQKQKTYFFDWIRMNKEMRNRPISKLQTWFFPELLLLYDAYRIKPWMIPIESLILECNENTIFDFNENKNINKRLQTDLDLHLLETTFFEFKNAHKEEKEDEKNERRSQGDRESNLKNRGNQQKDTKSTLKLRKGKQKKKRIPDPALLQLNVAMRNFVIKQFEWDDASFNEEIEDSIYESSFMLKTSERHLKRILLSSIRREEMNMGLIIIKDLSVSELIERGILILEPVRLSIQWNDKFIMYQTIAISLVHKSKEEINRTRHEMVSLNKDQNPYNFLVPESILSPRRRRELRILICLNSRNINGVDRNTLFLNENKLRNRYGYRNKVDPHTTKFMKFKLFLWPNYRLEDLACMNRYWFDTSNGSRFSMLRIHMYPRLRTS
uniref:Ycf1 protein n=2 Tax=Hypecoum erectum TaxID=1655241 RepID=UPI0028FC7A11|nr:Ycf1 protein [Hypecoum erectum]BET06407.1 Ycf1 protein [Hypecoum erectum]